MELRFKPRQNRFTFHALRIAFASLAPLLAACSLVSTPAPTATATLTSIPSATPTTTATPTSTPSPTPTATHTATYTPSPSPSPTATLTPEFLAYGPKGVGDAWQIWATPGGGTNLDALDVDWYYDWTFAYLPERNADERYVRMVWCGEMAQTDVTGQAHTIAETAAEDFIANRRGRVWLVYNEPDDPAQCGGHTSPAGQPIRFDPAYAARHFSQVYDLIKTADPNARVFAGGLAWLNSSETRQWWRDFVNTLRADGDLDKLEGVHIHLYPTVSTSTVRGQLDVACLQVGDCAAALAQVADYWYRNMHVGLGLAGVPIWISETGWLHCGQAAQDLTPDHIMLPIAQWFASDDAWPYATQAAPNPGYGAIAWYVTRDPGWFPCTYLIDDEGGLTKLGEAWSQAELVTPGPR
jgi:Glycosyl hydrolase catalytic core